MPPPAITASKEVMSVADSEVEWICGIEDEGGLGGDIGGAGDGGNNRSVLDANSTFEDGAENSFLPPDFARAEFAVGGKASHLGAGSGSAGRAIVGFAGTENKVAAVVGGILRGRGQLDVIDLCAVRTGDASRDEGSTNLPGKVSEFLDVLQIEGAWPVFGQEKPISSPRYVSGHVSISWNVDLHRVVLAIGSHVIDGDGVG